MGKKKKRNRKADALVLAPQEVKRAYELIESWRVGKPVYRKQAFENNVVDGYRKNELIYACIALKGDSAAQATLKAYDRGTGKELPNHPARQLILNPSRRLKLTEFDFHAANFAYLDLAGRAHWEIVVGRDGKPVELLPLRPDWLHVIPDGNNFLAGYEYKVPGVQEVVKLRPEADAGPA